MLTVRSILLVVGFAALVGCQTVQDVVKPGPTTDPNRNAVVEVENPATGKSVAITVTVGRGEHEIKGVKSLQVKDWNQAAERFRAALKENEKNYKAAFGLAVALEAMGQDTEAAAQYKAANDIESTQANLDGLARCEAKADQ